MRTRLLIGALCGFAVSSQSVAATASKAAKTVEHHVQRHPRSLDDRTFDVWRNPGRFTKNPDIIELTTGRLMLVYGDTEKHFSVEDIAVAPDGTIFCLYERGHNPDNPLNPRLLTVARFNLVWLTDGKDTLTRWRTSFRPCIG
jgi:hypothetical protein